MIIPPIKKLYIMEKIMDKILSIEGNKSDIGIKLMITKLLSKRLTIRKKYSKFAKCESKVQSFRTLIKYEDT